MTWTYSGNPGDSDRDAVRYLVGDTNTSSQLVSDEEISFSLSEYPDQRLAAAHVCDAIAAKYTRWPDSSADGLSSSASQIAKAYADRAAKLRQSAYSLAAPFFGGLSKSAKDDLSGDTDAVQPVFARGMDDNPDALSTIYGDDD